jgi:acetolactate synthase-1/2/3 large subunit
LRKPGLTAAARIKKAAGCDLFAPTLPAYIERGPGQPRVERIPYFPNDATSLLSRYDVVVLAGTPEPVTFFGYPGVRSQILADGQERLILCTGTQSVVKALEALADCLGAPARLAHEKGLFPEQHRPPLSQGELTPEKACHTIAALQPEGAIVVDEAVTSARSYFPLTEGLPPHSLMTASGGSIGYGIPCATGAAVACPGRPVITLQADGSAMYTVQALWTQAHEGLDITTLICSNRSYRILQMELRRAGVSSPGPNTLALTEMKNPPIDWVKIAEGLGVPGVTVSTCEALARELGGALAEPGPHLIEMLLP